MPTERRLRVNISLSCKTPADVVDKLLFLLQGPLRNYSHELSDKCEGDLAISVCDDESLGIALAFRSIPLCEVDIESMVRHVGCNDSTIEDYIKQRDKRRDSDDSEGQPTS